MENKYRNNYCGKATEQDIDKNSGLLFSTEKQ